MLERYRTAPAAKTGQRRRRQTATIRRRKTSPRGRRKTGRSLWRKSMEGEEESETAGYHERHQRHERKAGRREFSAVVRELLLAEPDVRMRRRECGVGWNRRARRSAEYEGESGLPDPQRSWRAPVQAGRNRNALSARSSGGVALKLGFRGTWGRARSSQRGENACAFSASQRYD